MIGIRFEIPNEYGRHLEKILSILDFDLYHWFIKDAEVLNRDYKNIFEPKVYLKEELMRTLQNDHYLIMLDLRVFPLGECNKTITTLREFRQSKCQLILLCCDSSFIDIYCKEMSILMKLLDMCEQLGYHNIQHIDEETDTRLRLSVW